MNRALAIFLALAALVLFVSAASATSVVATSTYPDCDPGNQDYLHWVQKIEYEDGSVVFLDLGEIKPIAHDGKVFWCQPLADQATFIAVYGPEVAPQAWTSQHNLLLEQAAEAVAPSAPPAVQEVGVCGPATQRIQERTDGSFRTRGPALAQLWRAGDDDQIDGGGTAWTIIPHGRNPWIHAGGSVWEYDEACNLDHLQAELQKIQNSGGRVLPLERFIEALWIVG